MKIKFLKLPNDVQQVFNTNIGCQNALRNLIAGRPSTPRSWFYEHKSADWCLAKVCKRLESSKDLKLLADWDLDFKSKFGPQGRAAPLKDRFDAFEEYFLHLDAPQIVSDPMFIMAQNKVIKTLGFNESGIPLSVDQVVEEGTLDDKYNTNSAYSEYLKKKNPKAIEKAKADASTCIEQKQPNTPGTRATPGKTEENARNIFMTAFAVVINGQRFQKPLQEYIRSKNIEFFAPWDGFDKVQEIASTFEPDTWKLSADYDKMDQHFNKHHGKACFEVIKHYFKREYWDELDAIIEYVFTQPILLALNYSDEETKMPEPLYVDQEHALVSGSEWTNFLETLWNLIFWTYMELKYHIRIRHKVGIGDDQLLEFESGRDWTDSKADKVLDLILWNFDYAGTPGNKKKNVFSKYTFDFCQRKTDLNYKGLDGKTPWALVYRLLRCLEMNVWPESYHNEKMVAYVMNDLIKVSIYNKYTFAIQVIMRSENCLYHWLLPWWIDFIWHCNPVIKEFVQLKDSEVLEQESRARKITNLYTTYNQEKANKHLTDFVVFKMLRAKLANSTGAKA